MYTENEGNDEFGLSQKFPDEIDESSYIPFKHQQQLIYSYTENEGNINDEKSTEELTGIDESKIYSIKHEQQLHGFLVSRE